jgi:transcriptional regulator with XRE-family HTH domain
MWESGRRNPRPKAVAHLAQTLNASYTWLLTGQGPMHLEGVAEQGTPYRADALDAELLAEIIAAIQEEFAAKGKKLLPKALGVFCVEAYQEAQRNPGLRGDALLERLKPFIRLALAGAS